jgi:thiol-disulfide isomerase/thioredoxin
MRVYVRCWPVAVVLGALVAAPPAVDAAGPEATPSAIDWEKDWKAALRRAREAGRPLLVDFWAEWCEWCHKLDATTYRDPGVAERARAFVAVKVNTEGSLAEAELAARYGAETLPTVGFLSPAGRLFLKRTAYEGPDRFPATLDEAARLAALVIPLEAALLRNGKDAAASGSLGALLADQGLHAEALELLRTARRADEARPAAERKRTRRALAAAELARGKPREAERLLAEALALLPADPAEDAAARRALAELTRSSAPAN